MKKLVLFLALVALGVSVAAAFAKPPPKKSLCFGLTPTITGTQGADVLNGTAGNDVIAAGAGNDQVNGLAGDDVLCGGPGNDTIQGGDGNDRISEVDGAVDRIDCGPGVDVVFADGEDAIAASCEDVRR